MNRKTLKILEYDKILERVASHAVSDAAKKKCVTLHPSTNQREIITMQKQTADALSLSLRLGAPSMSGTQDVSDLVNKAAIGSVLAPSEFIAVSSLLIAAHRVKSYYNALEEPSEAGVLAELFDFIEPLTPLREKISRIILSEDEIADDASAELTRIRRSKLSVQEKIRQTMNSYVADTTVSGYLQDRVVTTRNGRYCLSVKAENKSNVQGMIHDQSSTGSTFFIEPMAVVNLNNSLRELELEEQEEIRIILTNLSSDVVASKDSILTDTDMLVMLDFIFARAIYAQEIGGMEPVFNSNGFVDLKNARHPLLDAQTCVPVSIVLGDSYDLLLITGPNTGGKTVSLKTLGLLAAMAQSGLHIPASDRSTLPIFDNIYCDIGDEQSIEQSLSTFSSHMKNITYILSHVTGASLVLLDELCAGTDPTEGAAIATSILDFLHQKEVRTMATTHYSELKHYALATDGVENGSFEFSLETLSPTYRLHIGVPGKSNAFEISEKLGLPKDLIADARGRLDQEAVSFEDLVNSLEENRRLLEDERRHAEKLTAELKEREAIIAEKEEKLSASRDKLLDKANQEAAEILREAKEVADKAIRNFNKYGSTNPTIQELEGERSRINAGISKTKKKKAEEETAPPINMHVPKKLVIGDMVKVLSMNARGTVHTLPDSKGNLLVQMGIMQSRVNISDLVLIDEDGAKTALKGKKGTPGAFGKASKSGLNVAPGGLKKAQSIQAEVMLIGMTCDEALMTLDKYIDDAVLAHLSPIRIVHGKGSGVLRSAVHTFLKKDPRVAEYRRGVYGEGDDGVTIAELK